MRTGGRKSERYVFELRNQELGVVAAVLEMRHDGGGNLTRVLIFLEVAASTCPEFPGRDNSDGSVPFVGPLPSKMADFDGTLSDFGTLPALNSAYLEKDIYFLLPRTDYARRYQVGVWGGTFRSDLEKKGVCAGLCRERCLHDGVCLTTVTGPSGP
jgi:hypothetical protein